MPPLFGALPTLPRRRVVVSGLGAVTPLGTTVAKTWHNVVRGHVSTKHISQTPFFLPDGSSVHSLDTVLGALPCHVACPVIDDEPIPVAANGKPGVGRFAPTPREARSHKFCHVATLEALSDAKLLKSATGDQGGNISKGGAMIFDESVVPKERVAVNIGMGIPSLMDISDTARVLLHNSAGVQYNKVHPFFVPKILGNMAAGNIAIAHGFRGPIGSSVAACATGAHCIGEAARWIEEGSADVAVAGGSESCINPISIAGFARMRALATAFNNDPEKASRPFDAARSGFVMGEGAALLVLEELEHARARGATIYAELRGFGCTGDAYHVSSPDPSGYGAKTCVAQALRHAGVLPQQVAYINAHATSTPVGDEIELAALTGVFKDCRDSGEATSPVIVSSTKGALGHLLGAAGSAEAVLTVLSLHHKVAPPNVNLTNPIPHDERVVQLNSGTVAYHHISGGGAAAAVSTSFGFGGVNTALVFAEYSP